MAPKHGVYKTLPTLSWGGGSRSQVKPFMLIPGAAGTRAFWFSTVNGRGAGELRGRQVGSPAYTYPPMLRGPCAVVKNRGTKLPIRQVKGKCHSTRFIFPKGTHQMPYSPRGYTGGDAQTKIN